MLSLFFFVFFTNIFYKVGSVNMKFKSPTQQYQLFQNVKLKQFGDDTDNKKIQLEGFTQIPDVLYGIVNYDNDWNQPVDFKICTQEININSLQVKVEQVTEVYGVDVDILVINTQYHKNYKITTNKYINLADNQLEITEKIYFNPIFKGLEPKASVFLTGIKCNKNEGQISQNVKLEISETQKEFFTVKVSSSEDSCQLKTVIFNYIEFYNLSYSLMIAETSQQSSINLDSKDKKTINFSIKAKQLSQQNTIPFFQGINKMIFDQTRIDTENNPRIEIPKKERNYVSSNYSYAVQTRNGTNIKFFEVQTLLFYHKICENGDIFEESCIDGCKQRNKYEEGQFGCQKCEGKEKESELCDPCKSQAQPKSDKCKSSDENKNNCKSNAPFKLNNVCSNFQFDRTSCDEKKICQYSGISDCKHGKILDEKNEECIECLNGKIVSEDKKFCIQKDETPEKKCQDLNCDKCENQQECSKCNKGYDLRNNPCTKTECSIDNCSECSEKNQKNICQKCKQDFYLFNDICQKERPDGVFCDSDNKCQSCKIKNCKQCKNENECEVCHDDYTDQKQPQQCNCKKPGFYHDKKDNSCKKCESPCVECENDKSTCTKCGNKAEVKENTCRCIDTQGQMNADNNCFYCPKDIEVIYEDGQQSCKCNKQIQYYDSKSQECKDCKLSNCKKCSINGDMCKQCQSGYQLREDKKGCKPCGNGNYADENGVCNQKCEKGCIICTNNTSCIHFQSDHVFTGDKYCHFSCSSCLGNGEYDCLECSSDTREFSPRINSCRCKQGYLENQKQDCDKDHSDSQFNLIQSMSSSLQKGVYILFLPQLFFNIHPFNDYFLMTFQSLGNLAFIQNKFTNSLSFFSIFNYLNFYVSPNNNSQQPPSELDQESKFDVFFLTYTSKIDKNYSIGLRGIGIFSFLGLLIPIISFFFEKMKIRLTNKYNLQNILKNLSFKWFRVFSNLLLVAFSISIKEIGDQTVFGYILISYMILYYTFTSIQIIKSSKQILENNEFNYLSTNLKMDKPLQNMFWVFIEIRKIFQAILVGFIPQIALIYAMISVSIASFLMICFIKPFERHRRDMYYLLINETFCVSLLLLEILYSKQDINSIEIKQNFLKPIYITTVIFCLFQIVFNCEYITRKILMKIRQKKPTHEDYSVESPLFLRQLDMTSKVNFQDLESFLNSTSWARSPLQKGKKKPIQFSAIELNKL